MTQNEFPSRGCSAAQVLNLPGYAREAGANAEAEGVKRFAVLQRFMAGPGVAD